MPATIIKSSLDTQPRSAPNKPINARNGAQALAHNFGSHNAPPIIPGRVLTIVQRPTNNEKKLMNPDKYSIVFIPLLF
jgi:hypothetical protein